MYDHPVFSVLGNVKAMYPKKTMGSFAGCGEKRDNPKYAVVALRTVSVSFLGEGVEYTKEDFAIVPDVVSYC